MPCYRTGSFEGDRALALRENNEALRTLITKLTRVACDALSVLSEYEEFDRVKPETKLWWAKHEKIDRERKKMKT